MSGAGGTPPPTRIISWEQQVLEADPYFARERQQPWIYTFSNARRFYAPVNAYAPLPDSGLFNDGGVLVLISGASWPTTDAGLLPGALWNNGLAIVVVPGATPQPGAPRMTFPGVTSSSLLLFGGANFATTPPPDGSLILWSNGGLVCVA